MLPAVIDRPKTVDVVFGSTRIWLLLESAMKMLPELSMAMSAGADIFSLAAPLASCAIASLHVLLDTALV